MRKISAISVFLLLVAMVANQTLLAQPTGELAYGYLYSPDLDKIVQTYNFSRPWQQNPLVPLTHQYGATLGWNFKLSDFRQVHAVPQLGYDLCIAQTSNDNQTLSTGFHQFKVSVGMRFHPRAVLKGIQQCGPLGPRWFLMCTPGYSVHLPYKKTNGELLTFAIDEPYQPLTSSFQLGFGTGYHLAKLWRFVITPEVCALWIPQMTLHNYAEALNGHNQTGLNNEIANVLTFRASIRFSYISKDKSWWSRPREGDKS